MPIRVNALYCFFTTIAVDNYYKAKNILKEIIKRQDIEFCSANFNKAEQSIMITCVFSIMAIESYFNDFAARHLGDEEFYGNFDRMSLLSKFQLISKFILQVDIDKSKSYYSNLKVAEKNRNELVHNKSKDFFDWNKTNKEIDFDSEEGPNHEEAIVKFDIKTLKNDLKDAKCAIDAIKDLALFFDEADKSNYALKMLFSSFLSFGHDTEPNAIEFKKEFNIKVKSGT